MSRTTARVKVKLEVQLDSGWDEDCSARQVRDQAIQEANELISRAFAGYGFKMIEKPKVTMVMSELSDADNKSAVQGE